MLAVQPNCEHANTTVGGAPIAPIATSVLATVLQVESIMLSIISMLSSPNDESPANIDAAKQWRDSKDEFRKKVARIVRKSQEEML